MENIAKKAARDKEAAKIAEQTKVFLSECSSHPDAGKELEKIVKKFGERVENIIKGKELKKFKSLNSIDRYKIIDRVSILNS